MVKRQIWSRCSAEERTIVEELIAEYHHGKISSLDALSAQIKQKIGIKVSKSTLHRIITQVDDESSNKTIRCTKENNEKVLRKLYDQYKRGCSWREATVEAQRTTLSMTPFKNLKEEAIDDDEEQMSPETTLESGESDGHYGASFVKCISLSRRLKATMLNVYENGFLKQYALIRGDAETGRQYYRCTKCVECRRKQGDGNIAYIWVMNGKIISRSGSHHSSCKPLDENKVFARAVDRQCRLDVQQGEANPRLAHTKGMEKMMGTSLSACSCFPPWSAVRRAYYRHRTKQKENTPSSASSSVSERTMIREEVREEARESENSQLLANDETTSARLSLKSGSGEGTFFNVQRKHSTAADNGNVDIPDLEPGEFTYDGEVKQTCGDIEQSSGHLMLEQQPLSGSEDDEACSGGRERMVFQPRKTRNGRMGKRKLRTSSHQGHVRRKCPKIDEPAATQELLSELRAMKITLRQYEQRIRQLEGLLVEHGIIEI
uniref:RYYR-CCHC domain-containing protein n=1 Tax=Parascaris univalens TaxID=6257 RepID=A0A915BCC1_PARUN